MNTLHKANNQTLGEEIANAVTHGVGTLLAIIGTVVLIVYAAANSNVSGIVSAAVYGGSLILLYLISTLYHALTNNKAKKVFQVLDHCSIFLLILGSYVPICLVLLPPRLGWHLLGINLLLTIVGITLNAISLSRWQPALSAHVCAYGVVGRYSSALPVANAARRRAVTAYKRRAGLHRRHRLLCR